MGWIFYEVGSSSLAERWFELILSTLNGPYNFVSNFRQARFVLMYRPSSITRSPSFSPGPSRRVRSQYFDIRLRVPSSLSLALSCTMDIQLV